MGEWLPLLLRIRKVPGSNIVPKTGYPGVFVVLLSLSRQIPEYYLKLGHDRFVTQPFRFIVHLSPFHSTIYGLSY
jgi:hypothetical protein